MGTFTSVIKKEFEFDGDKVVVTFRRMKNKHFLKIAPFLIPDPNGPPTLKAGMLRAVKLVDDAKEILTECVVRIVGLTDAEGNPLGLETILEESFFISLMDEMLGFLMEESVLKGDEAKKSEGQRVDTTPEVQALTESLPESPLNGGTEHLTDVMT